MSFHLSSNCRRDMRRGGLFIEFPRVDARVLARDSPHPGPPHWNSNAESTKLNISTSSEALTTARVVATEVPSMVGSAWKPT